MRTTFNQVAILVILLFCITVGTLRAQFQIKAATTGGGFSVSTDSLNQLRATLGQVFIGTYGDTSEFALSGFWYQIDELVLTGIEDDFSLLPHQFELRQNYPNPFNPSTKIEFGLPKSAKVRLEIFNILGQRVARVYHDKSMPAGWHSFNWDGRNDAGRRVASGVYLYRMQAAGFVQTRKMILMR